MDEEQGDTRRDGVCPVILAKCHETDTKGAVTGQDDGTQEQPDG